MASRKPRRRTPSRSTRAARSRPARPVRKAVGERAPRSVRRVPESLRLRSITPGFTVNDLDRSLTFYTEVLGFFVKERWTHENGMLRGVMLVAGTCELGLSQDDWLKGRDRRKGEGFSIWCETGQDIDALAQRIKAAGVRLTDGPKDDPWGARSLSLDDPDGFHITIYREK